MKKIINQTFYDSEKSTRIVEVDANLGTRKLFKTINGNFFTLENDGQIVPCSKSEALDFLRIHQPKIEDGKFQQILNVHFGVTGKTRNPLSGALLIADVPAKNEKLHCSLPGRQFVLETTDSVSILSPSDALGWLETNQNHINNLDRVIRLYFSTIKRA